MKNFTPQDMLARSPDAGNAKFILEDLESIRASKLPTPIKAERARLCLETMKHTLFYSSPWSLKIEGEVMELLRSMPLYLPAHLIEGPGRVRFFKEVDGVTEDVKLIGRLVEENGAKNMLRSLKSSLSSEFYVSKTFDLKHDSFNEARLHVQIVGEGLSHRLRLTTRPDHRHTVEYEVLSSEKASEGVSDGVRYFWQTSFDLDDPRGEWEITEELEKLGTFCIDHVANYSREWSYGWN